MSYIPPHMRGDKKNVIVANPDEEIAAMNINSNGPPQTNHNNNNGPIVHTINGPPQQPYMPSTPPHRAQQSNGGGYFRNNSSRSPPQMRGMPPPMPPPHQQQPMRHSPGRSPPHYPNQYNQQDNQLYYNSRQPMPQRQMHANVNNSNQNNRFHAYNNSTNNQNNNTNRAMKSSDTVSNWRKQTLPQPVLKLNEQQNTIPVTNANMNVPNNHNNSGDHPQSVPGHSVPRTYSGSGNFNINAPPPQTLPATAHSGNSANNSGSSRSPKIDRYSHAKSNSNVGGSNNNKRVNNDEKTHVQQMQNANTNGGGGGGGNGRRSRYDREYKSPSFVPWNEINENTHNYNKNNAGFVGNMTGGGGNTNGGGTGAKYQLSADFEALSLNTSVRNPRSRRKRRNNNNQNQNNNNDLNHEISNKNQENSNNKCENENGIHGNGNENESNKQRAIASPTNTSKNTPKTNKNRFHSKNNNNNQRMQTGINTVQIMPMHSKKHGKVGGDSNWATLLKSKSGQKKNSEKKVNRNDIKNEFSRVSHVLEIVGASIAKDYQLICAMMRENGIDYKSILSIESRVFVVFDNSQIAFGALNRVVHAMFVLRRVDQSYIDFKLLKNNVPPPVTNNKNNNNNMNRRRMKTDVVVGKRMIDRHLAMNNNNK